MSIKRTQIISTFNSSASTDKTRGLYSLEIVFNSMYNRQMPRRAHKYTHCHSTQNEIENFSPRVHQCARSLTVQVSWSCLGTMRPHFMWLPLPFHIVELQLGPFYPLSVDTNENYDERMLFREGILWGLNGSDMLPFVHGLGWRVVCQIIRIPKFRVLF